MAGEKRLPNRNLCRLWQSRWLPVQGVSRGRADREGDLRRISVLPRGKDPQRGQGGETEAHRHHPHPRNILMGEGAVVLLISSFWERHLDAPLAPQSA